MKDKKPERIELVIDGGKLVLVALGDKCEQDSTTYIRKDLVDKLILIFQTITPVLCAVDSLVGAVNEASAVDDIISELSIVCDE